MRHALALILSLVVALPVESARAADQGAIPAAANVEEARRHFQRGAEFYREGNYDAALAEFTKAEQLAPNYRLLYNIGQVQAERHDYVAAVRALTDYLAQGGTELPEERRSQVQSELASLKTKIAELTVTSNVSGADVSIDGMPVGLLPLRTPLLVSAGSCRITVAKRGYTTFERTIIVAGEERPHVDAVLQPLVGGAPTAKRATPAAEPRTASPESSGSNTGGWLSVTAAGGFAAGAVVFGLMANHKNQTLDTELNRYPLDAHRVNDLRSDIKRDAALCDGLAGASAVSAIFAIYFFATGSKSSERPATTHARVVAHPSGLAVTGAF